MATQDSLLDASPVAGEALTPPPIVGKVLAAECLVVPFWLVGCFWTFGPFIAHNIEKKVGVFAPYCASLAWLPLLVTGLVALFKPTSLALRIFGVNLSLWVVFLAYVYNRWWA